jgi:hypothetical protein
MTSDSRGFRRGPGQVAATFLFLGSVLVLGPSANGQGASSRRSLTGCPPPPPLVLVVAPSIMGAGSPNRVASIFSFSGATYTWSITNGTITAGLGTNQITFTAGVPGTLSLSVSIEVGGCPFGGGLAPDITVLPVGEAVLFYPVTPCRLVDTRGAAGPLGGPALAATGGPDRVFAVTGACGIPPGATSLAVNMTVVDAQAAGLLSIYKGDGALSGTSTISFGTGQTRANDGTIQLATDGSGTLDVHNTAAGTVDFIIDVSGYFE